MIKLILWMIIGAIMHVVIAVYWSFGVGYIISKDDPYEWMCFMDEFTDKHYTRCVDWPDAWIMVGNIVGFLVSMISWPFGCLRALIVRIPQTVKAFIATR